MSMTSLLTLASMFSSQTQVTPPISYTTRLDIWMVTCISFVFAILLEFTVVIVIKHAGSMAAVDKDTTSSYLECRIKAWPGDYRAGLIRKIENLSSAGLLLTFVAFNGTYWIGMHLTVIGRENIERLECSDLD